MIREITGRNPPLFIESNTETTDYFDMDVKALDSTGMELPEWKPYIDAAAVDPRKNG